MANPVGGYPHLTKELVREILDAPVPYGDDEEKETCRRMVESLPTEEQRTAAGTSYAFWYALTYFEENDKPSEEDTLFSAMKEARRHLVASEGNEEVAMLRLRECCQFRKEYNIELIRTCYQVLPEGVKKIEGTPEEEEIRAKYRSMIEQEMYTQNFFVRGQDQESRAVVVKMGRTSPQTDSEAYKLIQFYIAERAIACTEYMSRGKEEKVVAVMDYQNYSSSNAPPIMCLKDGLTQLQTYYPERLKCAIMTEPPFWMRGIYNLLYPIMSQDTWEKVKMVSGEVKHETIKAMIDPEYALPFMMPDGQLTTPFDAKRFLEEVPFHCNYDSLLEPLM